MPRISRAGAWTVASVTASVTVTECAPPAAADPGDARSDSCCEGYGSGPAEDRPARGGDRWCRGCRSLPGRAALVGAGLERAGLHRGEGRVDLRLGVGGPGGRVVVAR